MKAFLGRGQKPISIAHAGGAVSQGKWLTRTASAQEGNTSLQETFALTTSPVESGDVVTDHSGQRWAVISVAFSRSGDSDLGIRDLKLGAIP